MTTNREMAERSALVRTSEPRNWVRPPGLVLLGLALFALVQAGCRSDGCSDCNLGSKISNGVQALAARVTKHFDGCHGGADCGCGGETVVDSGTPIISGGMVIPAPGTIVPAPAIEQPPTQLEPITPGTQSTSGATRSTPSGGANRSSYTTMAPKGTTAQRRGSDVARALHSNAEGSSQPDPLDNLPPVDLPSDVTKNATATTKPAATSPAQPSASPVMSPAAVVPTASPTASGTTTTPEATTPTPAEKVSAAEGAVENSASNETPSPFRAPGIRRYASIAPALAGGSAPSIEGLDWLKEKGCRTFIDLRKPTEVDPSFVEAVNDRNMVYISLPIVANRLDASRLARFDDLVAPSDHRPLYFCDIDGTRAGLVWYIHLRSVEQEDTQSATGKAEEVGLTAAEVRLAEAYLAVNKPRARASTSSRVALATGESNDFKTEPPPASAPAPIATIPPSETPRPVSPSSSPSNGPIPDAVPTPSTDPTPSMLPGEDRPQASNSRFRDPLLWRPVAALVLTGIGVPLAYWSRSAFMVSRSNRTRIRASLPGSVQPPSENPAGSDA